MKHDNDSEGSRSIWHADHPDDTRHSELAHAETADVCIIGAGIAGLATAYQLARDGRKVIVLDDGAVGGGETGRSTAHLSCVIDNRFHRMEKLHGEAAVRQCYESHAAAIDWFGETIAREEIDCGYTRLEGYLFAPPGEDPDVLRHEFDAARKAGAWEIKMLARAPLPVYDTGPAIVFPNQAQCDPLAFVRGLAHACTRMGVRIHGGMHVESIESDRTVRCQNGTRIAADSVVVATCSPVNNVVALHTKQFPFRTYAIAVPVARNAIPLALFWDTSQEPGDAGGAYHYARLQRRDPSLTDQEAEDEILIVGGEDHKTGQADDAEERWARLFDWASERFPLTGAVLAKWSGQVMEPVDGIAYLGRNPVGPDNVYVITGDSGMGLTHGAIGSLIISDLIAGRKNSWAPLYDPARKSIGFGGQYVRENINTAAQYADWISSGDVSSPDEIPANQGAIVRSGLRLLACYRDGAGQLHERSAVCTHLGGVVRWNSAEQSWDCPCHGSRFSPTGEVLNGPAVAPLAESHVFSDECSVQGSR